MVDYSVTNYNPYNMYHNYGYYYPSFNGAYTHQYQNIPLYDFNTLNYNYQPDTVTFSANNQVQAETKKQGISTGAKVAIGAGIVTALAVGADFLFCKGKHVKSIFGKAGNRGGSGGTGKPNVNPTNTTHSATSTPVNTSTAGTSGSHVSSQAKTPNTQISQQATSTVQQPVHPAPKVVSTNPTLFDGKSPVNINDYTPVQQRAREFAINEGLSEDMYSTNLSPETIYRNAVGLKYQNIRHANYKVNSRYNPNIDNITGASTPEITVINQNYWNYRLPKTGTYRDKSVDRISLNVYPEEQLITELDKYFASGKVKGYYKTPEEMSQWSMRHDPITIYLQEPINQSIVDDIVRISKPHIRSTENVLIGKIVSPGVALDKSPSTQELMNLVQEARQYDEVLANQLETSTKFGFARNAQGGDYTLHTSAGQAAAVRALLDDMAKAV